MSKPKLIGWGGRTENIVTMTDRYGDDSGQLKYSDSTITITLHPGPECDIEKLHDDADSFALRMADENHVMIDVVREESGHYVPERDD